MIKIPRSMITGKSPIDTILRYSFSFVGLFTPTLAELMVGLGVAVGRGVLVNVGCGMVGVGGE
jgi:hypothetical protein